KPNWTWVTQKGTSAMVLEAPVSVSIIINLLLYPPFNNLNGTFFNCSCWVLSSGRNALGSAHGTQNCFPSAERWVYPVIHPSGKSATLTGVGDSSISDAHTASS